VNIKTEYRPKPIPTDLFDWIAWYDGREESGCGYGRTEAEAIDDLRERIDVG
jgi:hypothetical protein